MRPMTDKEDGEGVDIWRAVIFAAPSKETCLLMEEGIANHSCARHRGNSNCGIMMGLTTLCVRALRITFVLSLVCLLLTLVRVDHVACIWSYTSSLSCFCCDCPRKHDALF